MGLNESGTMKEGEAMGIFVPPTLDLVSDLM